MSKASVDLAELDTIGVPDRWSTIVERSSRNATTTGQAKPNRQLVGRVALVASVLVAGSLAVVLVPRETSTGPLVADSVDPTVVETTVVDTTDPVGTDSTDPVDVESIDPVADLPDFVLPGEAVISRDPLVVIGALAPEPQFDTSDLGEEIQPVVDPDLEVPAWLLTVDRYGDEERTENPEITKVTIIGELGGEIWAIRVTDAKAVEEFWGPGSADEIEQSGGNVRERIVGTSSNRSGTGDFVAADSLEMIAPQLTESEGGPSPVPPDVGGLGFGGYMGWEAPAGTSVVAFSGPDGDHWTRPTAGVAIFPGMLLVGESATFTALSETGEVLATHGG